MMAKSDDRGARRRGLTRSALGKPGSLGRWVIGTAIWLFACAVLALFVPWGARIIIFVFAVIGAMVAFKARSIVVGDEDEFRAAVRRERKRASRLPEPDDEVRLAPEYWLLKTSKRFDDVPPPPILDDEPPDDSDALV